jgi:hypothetical protein
VFRVIASDIGRPLADLARRINNDHIGALPRIGPAARNHDRDFAIAELPRSENPGVAGYNSAGLVRENRVRPAPLLHARRYLRDLSLGVCPGVFRIRDQPVDWPPLNLIRRPVIVVALGPAPGPLGLTMICPIVGVLATSANIPPPSLFGGPKPIVPVNGDPSFIVT